MMDPATAIDTDDDGYYADEEMVIGIDCCPHLVPYGSDCRECDEDEVDRNMGMEV